MHISIIRHGQKWPPGRRRTCHRDPLVLVLCLAIFMANALMALASVGAFFAVLTCALAGFALDSEALFLRAPRAIS